MHAHAHTQTHTRARAGAQQQQQQQQQEREQGAEIIRKGFNEVDRVGGLRPEKERNTFLCLATKESQ